LITNAKIKSVTQDFDGISAAYYAHLDRTGNIPGDVGTAETNLDGVISDDDAFWFDLKTQNFIDGAPNTLADTDGPTHDLAGVWLAHPGDTDATAAMFTVNHVCATNVEESYAAGMDAKMDDGDPHTGKVRAGVQTDVGTEQVAAEAAAAGYDLTSTDVMTVCKEL